MTKIFCRLALSIAPLSLLFLAGCVTPRRAAPAQPVAELTSREESLEKRLMALGPNVREDEAREIAICAYRYPRELAREYHVVWPPLLHNILVNTGLRKRGLCYQWAEDLLARLQDYHLKTLEFHWGASLPGTPLEHNCVVVTARGQPFKQGIILDAWRRCGRIVWCRVASDYYPWREQNLPPSS